MINKLELLIPPPLVMITCAVLMKFLASVPLLSFSFGFSMIQFTLLGLCVLVGFVVAILGLFEFYRAKTTVNPHNVERTSTLVTTGIYRITRNPMYLGLACLLVGWFFWLSNFASISGVIIFVMYISRFQILPEEKILNSKFPDQFSNYSKTVRRWV